MRFPADAHSRYADSSTPGVAGRCVRFENRVINPTSGECSPRAIEKQNVFQGTSGHDDAEAVSIGMLWLATFYYPFCFSGRIAAAPNPDDFCSYSLSVDCSWSVWFTDTDT